MRKEKSGKRRQGREERKEKGGKGTEEKEGGQTTTDIQNSYDAVTLTLICSSCAFTNLGDLTTTSNRGRTKRNNFTFDYWFIK